MRKVGARKVIDGLIDIDCDGDRNRRGCDRKRGGERVVVSVMVGGRRKRRSGKEEEGKERKRDGERTTFCGKWL